MRLVAEYGGAFFPKSLPCTASAVVSCAMWSNWSRPSMRYAIGAYYVDRHNAPSPVFCGLQQGGEGSGADVKIAPSRSRIGCYGRGSDLALEARTLRMRLRLRAATEGKPVLAVAGLSQIRRACCQSQCDRARHSDGGAGQLKPWAWYSKTTRCGPGPTATAWNTLFHRSTAAGRPSTEALHPGRSCSARKKRPPCFEST